MANANEWRAISENLKLSSEKRSVRNYVETSPDVWAWQTEPSDYYIRSTVLGGEVVTNVNWQGEKTRTYVRGGGMEIAWQNGTSQNGSVVFQHRDPAGASFRSTDTSGGLYTNVYAEGGPAELDQFGTNVGSQNPYIQQSPGETCVGCEIINTEMPMYVNGQPLKTNLDGMNVPVSMAGHLVSSGSAQVDLASSSGQALATLGIYPIWGHRNIAPDDPDPTDPNAPITVTTIDQAFITGWVNANDWNLSVRAFRHRVATSPDPPPPPKSKVLQRAIDLAREMLKTKECNDAISSAIQSARSAAATMDDNRGASATIDEQPSDDGGGYLAWTGPTLTVTFYKGFYGDADSDVKNGNGTVLASSWVEDQDLRRAWVVLHELAHITGRYPTHNTLISSDGPTVNRAIYDACLKQKVKVRGAIGGRVK